MAEVNVSDINRCEVSKYIRDAASKNSIVKFYNDNNFYIQVVCFRDFSFSVSTNSRNTICLNELAKFTRQGWQLVDVDNFVIQWMFCSPLFY